jgi:beta-galactosidase
LHFEAVDYRCRVFVNDRPVGEHVGGNTPFTLDISEAVRPGENRLLVRVEDDTEGAQLNGKQSLEPRGIWYTQVSGIWQTVWLEQVPDRSIGELDIATSARRGTITVRPRIEGTPLSGDSVELSLREEGRIVATERAPLSRAAEFFLELENPRLWSPASPFLYDLELRLLDANGGEIDRVLSYAGIRDVGKTRDSEGHLRLTLNGEIIFPWGPLDQGWWPDGLLTPPSDEAMLFDIQFLRAAGFNMIRKHIKVEPRRYYYHCDRLGMMVWQDQVSGGPRPPWTRLRPNPGDADWSDEDHAQYMREFEAMVDTLEVHPSITMWIPFNEAWGQHRTMEVGRWITERDPSRTINIASGGNFWPVGDVVDHHSYPQPDFPFDRKRFADFVKVVGEFGGHGLPLAGHLWDSQRDNWGYGGLPRNASEYRERYVESLERLTDLQRQGIAAGVYTQTTDVEGEINGLMTYDRQRIKIPAAELQRLHQRLFEFQPQPAQP